MNIQQHIKEAIEQEKPTDLEVVLTQNRGLSVVDGINLCNKNKIAQELLLRGAEIALEGIVSNVSRIEVIDHNGRQFVKYFKGKCSIDLQDDCRTMKIFIEQPLPTKPNE